MKSYQIALPVLVACLALGCQKAYYAAWEKMGWEKRDILVDRVADARDDQNKAKEQFKSTLEQFQEVTNFKGGDLESKYKKLSASYDESESRAQKVRDRVASVDKVAGAMFGEWEKELAEYSNADLRRTSQQKLGETQQRYAQLLSVMRQAESKMDPVLTAFKDQVLFLKHNLNAQAISSLQTTAAELETDVTRLIADMEASIAEANAFISQMNKTAA